MVTARQQVLSAAYAAHPERFVRKSPQPPRLPHAVWINPPTKESTAQHGVGPTIAPGADPWVLLNWGEIEVKTASGAVSPDAITTPTEKVLH